MPQASCLRDTRPPWKSSAGAQDGPCPFRSPEHDGERYLVSMLGPKANWVRNVKAAGGHAVLRRRGREAVTLEEIPAEQRAPVLRRYLAVAPGARPHIPVDPRAPLSAFEGIAGHYPVFRIRARE